MKNGKSSGSDKILNEFLKHSPDNVVETITNLFNLVLKRQTIDLSHPTILASRTQSF